MRKEHRAGPLFTDLYELTMGACYYAHRVFDTATFSLYLRDIRATRNFFVAAGLEDTLTELADFHFSKEEIQYLNSTGFFQD